MFQASMLGDWWYLALQCAADYSNLLEYFAMIFWLALANWPNLVTSGWATVLKEVCFDQCIQLSFENYCIWHSSMSLLTLATVATRATPLSWFTGLIIVCQGPLELE